MDGRYSWASGRLIVFTSEILGILPYRCLGGLWFCLDDVGWVVWLDVVSQVEHDWVLGVLQEAFFSMGWIMDKLLGG